MREMPGAQGGAAGVEFALVLPVFLVLLFGVVEFALIMNAKGIITQASREGARYGVVYSTTPKTNAAIQSYVYNYLQNMGFQDVPLENITVTGAGGTTGSLLSVTVNYTYHFQVLPRFIQSMAGDLPLTAQSVMRLE